MLTNARNRVIYTGITSDIEKRILQHKYKQMEGFTKKYNADKLVHIEEFTNPYDALEREKEIKNWSRQKKIDLIEKNNPNWEELFIE